jgi:hypothetical protein
MKECSMLSNCPVQGMISQWPALLDPIRFILFCFFKADKSLSIVLSVTLKIAARYVDVRLA